jgi:TonB family protein
MIFLLAVAAVQAVPLSDPKTWIVGSEYPPLAMRNGDEGTVNYELTVDGSGTPTECRVIESSKSPILDAATCPILLKNARFKPTVSASRYQGTLAWFLDESGSTRTATTVSAETPATVSVKNLPAEYVGHETGIEFTISPEGHVTRCIVVRTSGSEELDRLACAEFTRRGRYQPAPAAIPGQRVRVRWEASASG